MSSLQIPTLTRKINKMLEEIDNINSMSFVLQDDSTPVTINQIRELLAHPRCKDIDMRALYYHVRELYLREGELNRGR